MSTADYIIIALIALLLLLSIFSIHRHRKTGNCCNSYFCNGDCKSCEKSHAASCAKPPVSSDTKKDKSDKTTQL